MAKRELGLTAARGVLWTRAEGALALLELVARHDAQQDDAPHVFARAALPAATRSHPADGAIDAMIAAAAALDRGLARVGVTLEGTETALLAAACDPRQAHADTVQRVAHAVGEARVYLVFVETDCGGIEAAGNLAQESTEVREAFARLDTAPAFQAIQTGVDEYARAIRTAVTALADLEVDDVPREAHLALSQAQCDLPRLRPQLDALDAAMRTAFEQVGKLAKAAG